MSIPLENEGLVRIHHLYLLTLLIFSAFLIGLPFSWLGNEKLMPAFFCLAASGWLLVWCYALAYIRIVKKIKIACTVLGIPIPKGSVPTMVSEFTKQAQRFHQAAFALRLNSAKDKNGLRHLSQCLLDGVSLVYREFNARSVELMLMDPEAGLWCQSLLLGASRSHEAQAALASESSNRTKVLNFTDLGPVILKPVSFAGNEFGTLRIELPPSAVLTAADKQVLTLLSSQIGTLLADSRFNEEVLRMRRLSEESTRAKTGFLANLSHEIRGPLGIILNGAELGLDGLCGEISDSAKDTLRMIKESGEHLLDLVNDVLDYAKVEAGKIAVTPCDISVANLLDDLSSVIRSQTNSKKQQLTVEKVDPKLGVICDKRHARQMLINFLTNANKYTPPNGMIVVSATRVKGNRVSIAVKDTGIGIAADQQDKVFAPFERVQDSYALTQNGTGLGMPLTRRLAELNGGTVNFESEEEKGSTFRLVLPGTELNDDLEVSGGSELSVVRNQGKGETILLVDNDTESRKVFSRYLESQGFNLKFAESTMSVLRALKDSEVALAIVENDASDLKGEDTVAAIRSVPKSQELPIILLSSKAFVFDIERFLKLGVDRCLSKPLPLEELAINARRLIDEASSLRKKGSQEAVAEIPKKLQ